MKTRKNSFLFLFFVAFSFYCSNKSDNKDYSEADIDECKEGSSRLCRNDSGCTAKQDCIGEPPKWGPCECITEPSSKDAATDRSGDSTGDARTEEPVDDLPALGNQCADDKDCAAGAYCLMTTDNEFFGGGPVEGTCVADCTGNKQACEAFTNAGCVLVSAEEQSDQKQSESEENKALCFELCILGSGQKSDAKCHGRAMVACEELAPEESEEDLTAGFCRPLCITDDDCEDRICDSFHAVCVDKTEAVESYFAQQCDPKYSFEQCDGICLTLSDASTGICTRRCKFGRTDNCAPEDYPVSEGGCLFAAAGGSIGDVGFCGQLCDCDDDCIEIDYLCDAFNDVILETSFGRKGVCVPLSAAISGGLSC